jgi:hypothetical protein
VYVQARPVLVIPFHVPILVSTACASPIGVPRVVVVPSIAGLDTSPKPCVNVNAAVSVEVCPTLPPTS